ncbi:MAG: hypothetical protein HYV41_01375 [Candidatus Magasanikbacteria bacterium]|nr:hypothetical protein [Candidatus Magasanikbacteria bacterium]
MKQFTHPFDINREIFVWGPVPGKFLFTSMFSYTNAQTVAPRFQNRWSKSMFLFKNNSMIFFSDAHDQIEAGKSMFTQYMFYKESRDVLYTEWKQVVENLDACMQEIEYANLGNLNDIQILELWKKFHEIYQNFWTISVVPELANYGSDTFLKELLETEIRYPDNDRDFACGLSNTEIMSLMEILTAPEKISFYAQEELDLLDASDIKKHAENFAWLKNSYAGVQKLSVEFFENRKKALDPDLGKKISQHIEMIQKRKLEVQKNFKLSFASMHASRAISDGMEWQDERKKYILKSIHVQDMLVQEISGRYTYTIDDLYNTWFFEITEILSGNNLHEELEKRRAGFGTLYYDGYENLYHDKVEYYWNLYQIKTSVGADKLHGMVVSKGSVSRVKGIVRILLDPHDVESFRQGEILVAPMTSPEYIFAMKKASAVITDVGGITSHAAVVSRELGIPCIVGTKYATNVLKDGDRVEIDVEKGKIIIVK